MTDLHRSQRFRARAPRGKVRPENPENRTQRARSIGPHLPAIPSIVLRPGESAKNGATGAHRCLGQEPFSLRSLGGRAGEGGTARRRQPGGTGPRPAAGSSARGCAVPGVENSSRIAKAAICSVSASAPGQSLGSGRCGDSV
jgi:hypothetical protein